MQSIHHASRPQPARPINFTDFAELPDDGMRPARKVRPKVNRLPLRVSNMKIMLADRYGPHLPDTEDARHDLLPHVHHLFLLNGPERARREALRLLPELSEVEIAGMVRDACWWDDDELGVYLEFGDADRTRLKAYTIGGYDCLRGERKKRRRRHRRDADRARRAAAGARARVQSTEQTRPWEQEGISRRTWYRRRSNGTDGTVSRPASLTDDGPARAVPDAAPAVEAFPHIETERAASEAVSVKASMPTPASYTTRADGLKEAGRREDDAEPVPNSTTADAECLTNAEQAARLEHRRRRERWELKQRERAAVIAGRMRGGIEIGPGEKILLDRIEKERQARFEASRERKEAERQASSAYQRWMARKLAVMVEAVREGLLPASVLEGRAA